MTPTPLHVVPEIVHDTIEQVVAIALGSEVRPTRPCDWRVEPWSSAVLISGHFRGAVTITCLPEFAYAAARRMLALESVGETLARDALSELVNVIGGNIKSQLASDLAEVCHLSVPIAATGHISIPRGRVMHAEWCEVDGHVVLVEITEGPPERLVS